MGDLLEKLLRVRELTEAHDLADREMRGNDAESLRFCISDACQDFVLGNMSDLLAAMENDRRYRFIRVVGCPFAETDAAWDSPESLDEAIDKAGEQVTYTITAKGRELLEQSKK